jgi:Ser/Thr protein kinase RdoA (MazF antagonist)
VVDHPLVQPAGMLGRAVLADWDRWEGRMDLPERVCHGDPKLANLRFDDDGQRAIGIIDLDTIGPMELACELGDAWRSWCNGGDGLDVATTVFDIDLFEASARGFLAHAPPLSDSEKGQLVGGIERICLELSARFCADALRNAYFREDRDRFSQVGTHNLWRAREQAALARSVRGQRRACASILATVGA